jgi:hypothetical protein
MRKIIVTLLSTSILCSCSSVIVSKQASPASISEGTSYFLPKRLHKLKVTATLVDPSKLDAQIKSAIQALKNIEDKKTSAEKTRDDLKSLADKTPTGKAKDDADKLTQAAEGIYQVAQSGFIKALSEYNQLIINKTSTDIAKDDADKQTKTIPCLYNFSMSITPQDLIPDPTRSYVAQLNHSLLHDDDINIKTTAAGLLTGSNATTTDRTGDVIVAIAEAIATFGPGSPPILKSKSRSPLVVSEKRPACPSSIPAFEQIVDFSEKNAPNQSRPKGFPLIPFPAPNGSSTSPLDKVTIEISKADLLKIGEKPSVKINGSDVCPSDISKPDESEDAIKSEKKCENVPGLLYRRDQPYIVQLKNDEAVIADETIFMPNLSPISVAPAEAGFMVTSKYETVFENGMLTSNKINRPSEALAIASLPTTIAKGFVGVLTDFIKIRYDNTKGQTDLIDQQTKLLEAMKKLSDTQKSVGSANP